MLISCFFSVPDILSGVLLIYIETWNSINRKTKIHEAVDLHIAYKKNKANVAVYFNFP